MLLGLWLLIAQLLGASPSLHAAAGGGAAPATAGGASVRPADRDAASDRDAALRGGESERVVAWLRALHPLGHAFATRGEPARSFTPSAATAAQRLSIDAAFVAMGRVRALRTSHAVAARGTLLPYFPTAPPLQG